MYPKNAASPEPIAIGAVVQISDGAVQTSGCTVRIKPVGVAEGDGAGTTSYSTDGIVYYTPTQAETNYTSFILIAKKTGCIPVAITVVTSNVSTAGKVDVQWFGGSAGTFSGGRPEVNTTHAAGTAWNSGAIGASTLAADTITAAKIATDAIDADALSTDAAAEIVAAIFAKAIESGITFDQLCKAAGAALAGKRSNAGTSLEQYDAIGNPGTARIVGNMDSTGNGTPTLTL